MKYNHGALIQRKVLEELNRETTHQRLFGFHLTILLRYIKQLRLLIPILLRP
ncbi:MAG: hypothetical protein ACFFDI_09320 [Promethearchaeota archaeon]